MLRKWSLYFRYFRENFLPYLREYDCILVQNDSTAYIILVEKLCNFVRDIR